MHLATAPRFWHPATFWLCLALCGLAVRMGKSSLNAFVALPDWMLNIGLAGMVLVPPAIFGHGRALGGERFTPASVLGLCLALGFAAASPWIPNQRGDPASMWVYMALLAWGFMFVLLPGNARAPAEMAHWARAMRGILAAVWAGFLLVFLIGSNILYVAWCALFALASSILVMHWFSARHLGDHYTRLLRSLTRGPELADAAADLLWKLGEDQYFRDPDLTLRRFARRVGVPEKQASTLLASIPPFHFRAHLNGIRIRAAQAALRAGWNGSITELAMEVGYNSPSAFSRAFRTVAGVSPSTWRADADV